MGSALLPRWQAGGTYDTELAAARARDAKVMKFRTAATLNFPITVQANLLTALDTLAA